MAKRQAAALQTDLQTDEDFDRFIEKSGLCVIDVYSEWCGPCLGMVGSLRKIKMEPRGDILNLAIAKSDTISYVNRFYKKSEPTWLFITNGKAVNIMFGVDCPKFLKMIRDEIKLLGSLKDRPTYSVTEMLPKEIERDNVKNAAKRAKAQKEHAEMEQKKKDHFYNVTNVIHDNLRDIGITVFGPHVNRDTFRHLIDYGAEKFGIQCKERRNQVITKEQFEVINFACENPLPAEILDEFVGKELFICYWKVTDASKGSPAEVLQKYAEDIVKEHRSSQDEEEISPPLVRDAKRRIAFELPVDEECPEDDHPASPEESRINANSSRDTVRQEEDGIEVEESGEDEEQNINEDVAGEPQPISDVELRIELNMDHVNKSDEENDTSNNVEKPKQNICYKTITVPAIWVPKDWRTHAALIYVLFRSQTSPFLPPDLVPETPHVIMAFDTYKKRDLIEFAERNTKDIPLYGFFTSDEPEEAMWIASSRACYALHKPSPSDKLVFKVNKSTSHTMLSLATYGPTYVSPNTTVGAEEAKIFFPEGYVSAENEMMAELAEKWKTPKGGKVTKDQHLDEKEQAEAAATKNAEEEVAPVDAAAAAASADSETVKVTTEEAANVAEHQDDEGRVSAITAGEPVETEVAVESAEVPQMETVQAQDEQPPQTVDEATPMAPSPEAVPMAPESPAVETVEVLPA